MKKPTVTGTMSWDEKRKADLALEVQGRELLLARVITRGQPTHEERIIGAILRLLDHERICVTVEKTRRNAAWNRQERDAKAVQVLSGKLASYHTKERDISL